MGVNLIAKLDSLQICEEQGGDGSASVNKGNHRILRFNLHVRNIGDQDLVVGDPTDPNIQRKFFDPAPTELTGGLGFKFNQPFFAYSLRNDDSSVKISGYKIPICFDVLPGSSGVQGIVAGGGEDQYVADSCTLIIDDVPDSEYILEATVNAPSVDAVKNGKGEMLFEEDRYDDNTFAIRVQIKGDAIKRLF
jgi:hypothetical protein